MARHLGTLRLMRRRRQPTQTAKHILPLKKSIWFTSLFDMVTKSACYHLVFRIINLENTSPKTSSKKFLSWPEIARNIGELTFKRSPRVSTALLSGGLSVRYRRCGSKSTAPRAFQHIQFSIPERSFPPTRFTLAGDQSFNSTLVPRRSKARRRSDMVWPSLLI